MFFDAISAIILHSTGTQGLEICLFRNKYFQYLLNSGGCCFGNNW